MEASDLEPLSRLPRKFGRYALFDFVGKGGMAEIFLARAHTDLGASRLCVVKQILPEFAHNSQFAEMLIHEAKLAARLSHAHIVQVFDLGREGDQLYIAMEYVEGFDLNALLRRCSQRKVPLPFDFALRIACDALQGLDYAHRRTTDEGKPLGIVHRDVSPSNVLVSFEGEVKVCDFGIAHANDIVLHERGEHMAEAIKGKAGYMSPEHARGEPIDARADVFAVGILLWELIAGKRMYRKESDVPLLEQAKRAETPELAKRGLPLEDKLQAIVQKALAVKRDERYPTAGALLRELESYMSAAKLVASPLKLGDWMMESFGAEVVEQRRARERLAPQPASVQPGDRHSAPPMPSVAPSRQPSTPSFSRISAYPGPTSASSIIAEAPPAPPTVVARPEPDPPSFPASTTDVVPSSSNAGLAPPEKRSKRLMVVLMAVGIALAAFIAFLAGMRH